MSVTGFKYPFAFQSGSVATSADDKHIADNVTFLVLTNRGEIPMLPEFGSNIGRRVFDNVNLVHLISHDVRDSISRYFPNISLLKCDANFEKSNLGEVEMLIEITIPDSDDTTTIQISTGS